VAGVRRAAPGDAVAIARVHVASWKAGYRGVLPDDYLDALAPEDRIPVWEELLGATGSAPFTVFVAVDDDEAVVGFASLRPAEEPGVTPLGALYVDPNAWNRGFGGQLLDAVTDFARAGGDTEVSLWVHPENRRARAVYEHRGWIDTGVEQMYTAWGLELPEREYRLAIA
jgi:RimJ/RimL family protein N-acetyltransferase